MLAAAHAPQVKSFVKTCGVRKNTRFFSQATVRSAGDMVPNKKTGVCWWKYFYRTRL